MDSWAQKLARAVHRIAKADQDLRAATDRYLTLITTDIPTVMEFNAYVEEVKQAINEADRLAYEYENSKIIQHDRPSPTSDQNG